MSERETPSPDLPEELASFLKSQEYAWVMQATNLGTVFYFKAPSEELASLSGSIGVSVNHGLYNTPLAPVIRSTIIWFDRPESQLVFETFTNIRSPSQSAEFVALATQRDYLCAFYDESLYQRLAKRIQNRQHRQIRAISERAQALSLLIPEEHYDFDQAKEEVVRQTRL